MVMQAVTEGWAGVGFRYSSVAADDEGLVCPSGFSGCAFGSASGKCSRANLETVGAPAVEDDKEMGQV